MDKKLIRVESRTTPIELCDILTAQRQLVHAKKTFSSTNLSHLFSQGAVAAALIQENAPFRDAAQARVMLEDNGDAFAFFSPDGIQTAQFEVVYAVVGNWRGRSPSQALPFFSKVNLRRTGADLRSRGFRMSLAQVQTVN